MSRKSFNGIDDSSGNSGENVRFQPGINIDFSSVAGKVKELHGINNSPVTFGDALPELKDAGIPYVRLHDSTGLYGGTYFVDVPNIFSDFDADPNDPASYDFTFTDAYLKGLVASGVKIFYRLGVTIENNWRIKPYRIYPPKDFSKWAQICAGIIRHYNQGWADGFEYDIEYWEIWNEPENPPMWQGTREEFFELYRIAANYLKAEFPQIKVGGYASCGFYAVNRPEQSDFYKSFVTYFDEFLKYVTTPATAAPLDFYSWHLYTDDPNEIILHSNYIANKLTEYGLNKTENIFNEWNYVRSTDPDIWDNMKEMPGAAFTAAAFCLMQYSDINKAMYYDALPTRRYCGLYYFPSQRVTKTYFSFKIFNELYKLGTAVECGCRDIEEVYVCASKNLSGQGAVLVVNCDTIQKQVPLSMNGLDGKISCLLLDSTHVMTETNYLVTDSVLSLPPLSVVLVRIN